MKQSIDNEPLRNQTNCSEDREISVLNATCAVEQCNDFKPDEMSISGPLLWTFVGLAFLTFIILCVAIYLINHIWLRAKANIDGWPWEKEVSLGKWRWKLSRFRGFLPRGVITFILLVKVIIAIPVDMVDIMTDGLYFFQITHYSDPGDCSHRTIIDRRIRINESVYWMLFCISLMAMIKHCILLRVAYRKIKKPRRDPSQMPTRIRRIDLGESDLMDKNAYMEFTFLQGVFAFLFQDAFAAFIQFNYIDKYLVQLNKTVFINASLMTFTAARLMYLFTKYIFKYWERSDRRSLKVLHSVMLSTYASIGVFQFSRAMLLLWTRGVNENYSPPMECFEFNAELGLFEQKPFAEGCWTTVDYIFTASIGLSTIGVITIVSLIGINGVDQFKIFTQANYATRTAAINKPQKLIPTLKNVTDPRTTHLMSRNTQMAVGKLGQTTDSESTTDTLGPVSFTPRKY